MFSLIGHGFHLDINSKVPRVAKKIAQSAWGLFEISATDLILLRQAAEQGLATPPLQSLQCIAIAPCRRSLVN